MKTKNNKRLWMDMETSFPEIITDPMHETTCIKCKYLLDISGLPTFTQIACPECGTQQGVPGKMGAFVLVDLLGKGGMGAVYRGRDIGLDRWVAVKVMQSSFGGNPEFVETFRREAQAAAALNHPNIVQIYSFGVSHGQPYLVMELLEGGRLDHMIAKGEFINEATVLKIGADVAEGLNAAATISLIHGDVKPENILMDANGVAKVVDFGLAQFKAKTEGNATKGIWGTPYYIAPEKLRGHEADARSDIYSLGGTLFHALALKPPFEGETPMDVVKARLKAPAPLLHTFRPGIHPEVESIVARMLEAEPQKRYPNYASLLTDLRRVWTMLPVATHENAPHLVKKGGKFVLTKKKAGMAPPPSMMTAGSSGAMAQSGSIEAEPEEKRILSPRRWKIVLWSLLGVFALAGMIGGGYAFKVSRDQKAEVEREKEQIARHLKRADQILKELQPIATDFSNRVIMAGTWSSNAQQVVSLVSTGMAVLPEAGEWVGASSNAAVVSEAVAQFLVGTMERAQAEFRSMADEVATQRVVIATATNPAIALTALSTLTNIPGRVSDLHKSVSDEMNKIQKDGEAMASLIPRFSRVMAAAIQTAAETAEKAAREKVLQEKQEAERLAAEKREAEKQEKIQADMAELDGGRRGCVELVQQHKFAQAFEIIEQTARQVKTPEGKAKAKQMVKAYRLLAELKVAIIDGIKAEVKANPETGYRFGWLGAKDILNADEYKVVTRDAQYTWEMVPAAQMMRFIKYYIEPGGMGRIQQAEHFFAVALYIHESYSTNEKAMVQAAKFLKDAINGSSGLEDTAKAVLPGMTGN